MTDGAAVPIRTGRGLGEEVRPRGRGGGLRQGGRRRPGAGRPVALRRRVAHRCRIAVEGAEAGEALQVGRGVRPLVRASGASAGSCRAWPPRRGRPGSPSVGTGGRRRPGRSSRLEPRLKEGGEGRRPGVGGHGARPGLGSEQIYTGPSAETSDILLGTGVGGIVDRSKPGRVRPSGDRGSMTKPSPGAGPPGRASCWTGALALLLLAGCGGGEPPRSIVPDAPTGRAALETALSAWRAGKPAGRLDVASPGIQVIDTFRAGPVAPGLRDPRRRRLAPGPDLQRPPQPGRSRGGARGAIPGRGDRPDPGLPPGRL